MCVGGGGGGGGKLGREGGGGILVGQGVCVWGGGGGVQGCRVKCLLSLKYVEGWG